MKIIAFNPFKHAQYLDKAFNNIVYDRHTKGVVAVYKDEPVGIFLLKSWTKNAVQIHVSIQNNICLRTLVPEMFKYVFETCGRKVIYGLTPAENPAAVNFAQRLGFREVYRIKDGVSDGVDSIFFEIRREECQYLTKQREAA